MFKTPTMILKLTNPSITLTIPSKFSNQWIWTFKINCNSKCTCNFFKLNKWWVSWILICPPRGN